MQTKTEPLFTSAHAAVRWALSDERVALQQSSLYRSPGSGRGLSGFDGAGQAGIIISAVYRMGSPHADLVMADAASVKLPCACRRDCCSGWRSNQVWIDHVNYITAWWIETNEPGCKRPRLVMGCLRRFFGENISMEAIGKRNAVSKALVVEANGLIVKPLKPLRDAAWARLDEGLTALGLLEDKAKAA
jgi:hypothetical protein